MNFGSLPVVGLFEICQVFIIENVLWHFCVTDIFTHTDHTCLTMSLSSLLQALRHFNRRMRSSGNLINNLSCVLNCCAHCYSAIFIIISSLIFVLNIDITLPVQLITIHDVVTSATVCNRRQNRMKRKDVVRKQNLQKKLRNFAQEPCEKE